MTRKALLIVLFILITPSLLGKASQEEKLKYYLSKELIKLGEWCYYQGISKETEEIIKEAESLYPQYKGILKLKKKLSKPQKQKPSARENFPKKQKYYGKKIYPYYLKLQGIKTYELDKWPALKRKKEAKKLLQLYLQYDQYLVRAYLYGPSKLDKPLQKYLQRLYQKKEFDRIFPLLQALEKIKQSPQREKWLAEIETSIASSKPVLKQATGHAMKYYLVLPKGWTKKKKWEVLVAVEGAGCNFLGYCRSFIGPRGDLPFLIVVPHTFSNTNQINKNKYHYSQEILDKWGQGHGNRITFDSEGLLAVLKDLQSKYNAKEKIFITGFSGGGNLTWCMIFCHPEKVRGAAPACANFYQLYSIPPGKKEVRQNLPIKAFQGDKDQYINSLLNPQWESAKKLCDSLGYQKVSREMVPGVGHSGCSKKVMEYFKELLGS